MDYTLFIRMLVATSRRDKARELARRLCPAAELNVVGRYWKDDRNWELQGKRNLEDTNDKDAVWETLMAIRSIFRQWYVISGPNDDDCEMLFSAVAEDDHQTGLWWCSFELCRGGDRELEC